MNIRSIAGCLKYIAKISQASKVNKYVKISPELEVVSPEAYKYLQGIKQDIVTFAKSNKVKVSIKARENHLEILDKYNMEFLDTKIKYLKKVKQNPYGASGYMDTNSQKSVFGLFRPFEKPTPYKENQMPFKDGLLGHLKLVMENLKNINSI